MLYPRFVLLTQLFVLMFADSVMERRGLRERVFPKLREYCRHTLGLDVRVRTIAAAAASAGKVKPDAFSHSHS